MFSVLDPHGFALGDTPQGRSRQAQGCRHVTAGVRGWVFLKRDSGCLCC